MVKPEGVPLWNEGCKFESTPRYYPLLFSKFKLWEGAMPSTAPSSGTD